MRFDWCGCSTPSNQTHFPQHHHPIMSAFLTPFNSLAFRGQVARHGGKGKGHHRYPSAPITVPNCWQHLSSVDLKKSIKRMGSFLNGNFVVRRPSFPFGVSANFEFRGFISVLDVLGSVGLSEGLWSEFFLLGCHFWISLWLVGKTKRSNTAPCKLIGPLRKCWNSKISWWSCWTQLLMRFCYWICRIDLLDSFQSHTIHVWYIYLHLP